MKKTAVIALILGIIMILTSVVLPIFSIIVNASGADDVDIGIIGGADGPTAILVVSEFFGAPAFALTLLTVAVIAASIITVIIFKKKKK